MEWGALLTVLSVFGSIALLLLRAYIAGKPQREARKKETEQHEIKEALANRDADFLARDIDKLRDRKKSLSKKR